ncbi:MAG: transporter [Woeseiaceae bacterium]
MQKYILVIAAMVLATHPSNLRADQSVRADSHGPIGVMGDHMHMSGEWMFSYRFMRMNMQGNLRGSRNINPDTIVTTEENRFFGMPNMPPTLRIVPRDMEMDMHMLGLMYAPNDRVTLMFMTNYLDKSMNHTTYAGGAGTNVLGEFRTATSGWGDLSISSLIRLTDSGNNHLHGILGVSVPIGSQDERGEILAPTGMTPTVRLPYPMQLGSGSYDPIVGLNFTGKHGSLGWGGQWRSVLRLAENDDDYQLGDEHRITAWLSYLFSDSVSGSTRIEYYDREDISGLDPLIAGPVQTADPDRQAIQRLDIAFGLNFVLGSGHTGWRLGLEYLVPVDQRLDGPQLKTDDQLILGVQKAF